MLFRQDNSDCEAEVKSLKTTFCVKDVVCRRTPLSYFRVQPVAERRVEVVIMNFLQEAALSEAFSEKSCLYQEEAECYGIVGGKQKRESSALSPRRYYL